MYYTIINWYYFYYYTFLFLIFLWSRNMTKVFLPRLSCGVCHIVRWIVVYCFNVIIWPKIMEYCNFLFLWTPLSLFFHLSVGVFSSNSMLLWQTAVHHPPRRCILQLPEQVSIIHTIHYIHTTRIITHTLFLILCGITIQKLSYQLY